MSKLQELQLVDLSKPGRPPLCIDCHWFSKSRMGEMYNHRCLAEENYDGINLIDGDIVMKRDFCLQHRTTNIPELCGVEGRWFKQKEYIPPAIIATEISNITRMKPTLRKISSTDLDNL